LFLNPRSSASLNVRGKTPGVALPSGTLPENGVWPRAPAGLLDWSELLGELLLYEDEVDGAGGASVGAWADAGWQRKTKLATTHRTPAQAKLILSCRNCFLGLRSFIDDKQGHEQPNNNVMLIQAAAV
jgi:hypothetical protein